MNDVNNPPYALPVAFNVGLVENQPGGGAPHLSIRTITSLMVSWMTPALIDYIHKKTSSPVTPRPPIQQKQQEVVVRDSYGARYNLPVRLVQETTMVQRGVERTGRHAHTQAQVSGRAEVVADPKPQAQVSGVAGDRGKLATAGRPVVNHAELSAPNYAVDMETSQRVGTDRSVEAKFTSDWTSLHDRTGTPGKEPKPAWQTADQASKVQRAENVQEGNVNELENVKNRYSDRIQEDVRQTSTEHQQKVREEWHRLQQDRSAFEYDKQYERDKLAALQQNVQRDTQNVTASHQLQQELEQQRQLLAQEKDNMASDKHQLEIQWRKLNQHKQDLAADREDMETEKEQLRREWLLLSEEQNFRQQDRSKRRYLRYIQLKHLRMFKL